MTTPNDEPRRLQDEQLTEVIDRFCAGYREAIDRKSLRGALRALIADREKAERDRCVAIVTDAYTRIDDRTVRKVLDRVRASIAGGIAEFMA